MALTAAQPPWRFDQGGDILTGTALASGRWRGLLALSATTLDTGTESQDINGTLAGVVIPAGTTLHGLFTAVKLSSGTVLAYR